MLNSLGALLKKEAPLTVCTQSLERRLILGLRVIPCLAGIRIGERRDPHLDWDISIMML